MFVRLNVMLTRSITTITTGNIIVRIVTVVTRAATHWITFRCVRAPSLEYSDQKLGCLHMIKDLTALETKVLLILGGICSLTHKSTDIRGQLKQILHYLEKIQELKLITRDD